MTKNIPNKNTKILITDTSILINFLTINRIDLLGQYPGDFFITEHVVEEITNDFTEQQTLLNSSLSSNQLAVVSVHEDHDLAIYNDLIKMGRLGSGECSAIAYAINRKYSLAMEDSRACKQAKKQDQSIEIIKTQDIIIKLIENEVITIREADKLKEEWQTKHRFTLKFDSFSVMMNQQPKGDQP